MFVDDDTFAKLLSESQSIDAGAVSVKAVSPRHLLTLKIHALKHFQEHRFAKDYSDVLQLLRLKENQMSDEELCELCCKYADSALFDRIQSDRKR